MQRVPWMCWKRMSDNWKAYIPAYAWPAPVSSRILWSLLLLSHSNLNRDSFFPFLSVRELWNFIYFGICSVGKWTSSGEESGTSVGRRSILVLSSAKWPKSMIAWPERRLGDSCRREKGGMSSKVQTRGAHSLWPLTLALWLRVFPVPSHSGQIRGASFLGYLQQLAWFALGSCVLWFCLPWTPATKLTAKLSLSLSWDISYFLRVCTHAMEARSSMCPGKR